MMTKPAAKRPPQRDIHDDRRPLKKKKKPAIMSEDAKALSMIRQMFKYYFILFLSLLPIPLRFMKFFLS